MRAATDGGRAVARCVAVGLVAWLVAAAVSARVGGAGDRDPAATAPWFPALARAPLDGPLQVTGGFGDYRGGHFHAGVDLGTGGRVGRPVYAPLEGWLERVRASGVGYGRSLYLHTTDGRLLVFGHLDAFDPTIASFVAARQDSSGQYEQDLWPEPGRLRVRAGQRIAWSGESGAGPPHLHFEIRRGDMAYHPRRAGLQGLGAGHPRLASLTLEPLDASSFVERRASPFTVALHLAPETLRVEGRVRAVVSASEGGEPGSDRRQPWSVEIEFDGRRTECRFDSLSWATDMDATNEVYDAGRVVGGEGLLLWSPAGFRPRVIRSSVPAPEESGTLEMREGDPERTLSIVARDPGGEETRRIVVLRAPRPGEAGPDTTARQSRTPVARAEPRFGFTLLPGGALRVSDQGAPPGSHAVRVNGEPATLRGTTWSAVLPLVRLEDPARAGTGRRTLRVEWLGRDGRGRPWLAAESFSVQADGSGPAPDSDGVPAWSVPRECVFEPGITIGSVLPEPAAPNDELVPMSRALRVAPETRPLRRSIPVSVALPSGAARPQGEGGARRLALYRQDGRRWQRISSSVSEGRVHGESGALGVFALFSDTLAPRILPHRPRRVPVPGPYSRWALSARLIESGSGVQARESYFTVDGARVPSEWDEERAVLRWRPTRPPARGAHRYEVVAVDRAGNRRLAAGTFVLD